MFDVGFFELLIVAVVGLVVIGPERLPGAIRAGALWWGRLKRSMRETRTELERQLGADDIRRELHNEEVMRSLEALRESQHDLQRQIKDVEEEAHDEQPQRQEQSGPASQTPPDSPPHTPDHTHGNRHD